MSDARRSPTTAHRGDVEAWRPLVREVLHRHRLPEADGDLEAGFNPTYPTFLTGEIVVKLFGGIDSAPATYAAERAALEQVAADPEIAAPRIVARGELFPDDAEAWPYLITTRISGRAWQHAGLAPEQRRAVAAELGEQLRRVHALEPPDALGHANPVDLTAAAARSSLPSHLVAQVDAYVSGLHFRDPVFVHGDLCAMHAFVENGRLTGIIDWGDAAAADPHYEIIQLYRSTFGCQKALLETFLDAYGWPVGEDFARRALGFALVRQATGLAQHHGMDVFESIADRLPLQDFTTLDELASALFGT